VAHGGVEPDVRIRLIERAVAELGELLVEEGADPAHLAAADAAATQGSHEVIDLARADAEHVSLLDHRQERSVDASPWLEQGREEAARAQLGDLQLEASRAGVEDPLPVAVAVRGACRRSLVRAGADLRGRLSFDQPLHGVFENAPEHVRVSALQLIEQRLVRHPVLGHRGSPGLG